MSEICVVVVAYLNADDLERCLASVREHPVVVVDNSSSEAVRHAAASVHYVDAEANVGFARGVNLGLADVAARYPGRDVLLLNPDAELRPGAVDALVSALKDEPSLAAVAPRLLTPRGVEQRAAWPWPTPLNAWREAVGMASRRADFVVGAAVLLSARALDDVGPFDERFFLYAEETDWQRRAHDRGWGSRVVRHAEALHQDGGTSPTEGMRAMRRLAGQETYVRKWHGRMGWQSYRLAMVLNCCVRWLLVPATRSATASRLRLYVRGPVRCARRASAWPAAT